MGSTRLRRIAHGRPNTTPAAPTIFVHIPKCAGKSVHASLGLDKLKTVRDAVNFYHSDIATSFGHMSLRGLVEADVISATQVKRAFVFTIVRNPYGRAISLYRYLRQIGRWDPALDPHSRREGALGVGSPDPAPMQADFLAFLGAIGQGIPTVGLYNTLGLSQCNPQHHWLEDVEVDFIGRYEQLEQDFQEVSRRVLGERRELPHVNVSKVATGVEMADFLNEEAVALIRQIYREDFRRFGYSLDVPT